MRKAETIDEIINYSEKLALKNCQLATFGEAILPDTPLCIERTNEARFNAKVVREEKHHFNFPGHFSEPDVFQHYVNRKWQNTR